MQFNLHKNVTVDLSKQRLFEALPEARTLPEDTLEALWLLIEDKMEGRDPSAVSTDEFKEITQAAWAEVLSG